MICTILRRPAVTTLTGLPRSTLYFQISEGTFTKPISIGRRTVGWPEAEVEAINAARIGGMDDDAVRILVKTLHDGRGEHLKSLISTVLIVTPATCEKSSQVPGGGS